MTETQWKLTPGEDFPADRKAPGKEDILNELAKFGIESAQTVRLVDSTRGPGDIRLNYIIDKRWVLRFCNAPDMTEKRMGDLDRLTGRYRASGCQAPAFVADGKGKYLHPWEDLVCYLSQYIDLPLARERGEDYDGPDGDRLMGQVMEHTARFAQAYRDVDLSDTMGMYSLFDLSPFDIPAGIDEKQDNFNDLMEALRRAGEGPLADRLEARHADIRRRLKGVYKDLPRCVFQGDENFSNVLVDEKGDFAGLIDFNLAGTEVVVNQLANLAGFDYGEEHEDPMGARARLDRAVSGFRKRMAAMFRFYRPNEAELQALVWYAWIVMVAQYPTAAYFIEMLEGGPLKEEIRDLLSLIADLPEEVLGPERT